MLVDIIKREHTSSATHAIGWKKAIEGVKAEIHVRHYSPNTLRAYTNWIKQFQGFTRNKDVASLSSFSPWF